MSAMACSSGQGTSVPITAAVWSRRLSSGGSRSMRAASTACTVAGAGGVPRAPGRREATGPAPRSPGLSPGRAAASLEEGMALGAGNQELFEGFEAGVIPQQRLEERVSAGRRQGVEAELRVVRLAAPAVLVLRAIIDQQEQARRRQALHQAVQQGLRLG